MAGHGSFPISSLLWEGALMKTLCAVLAALAIVFGYSASQVLARGGGHGGGHGGHHGGGHHSGSHHAGQHHSGEHHSGQHHANQHNGAHRHSGQHHNLTHHWNGGNRPFTGGWYGNHAGAWGRGWGYGRWGYGGLWTGVGLGAAAGWLGMNAWNNAGYAYPGTASTVYTSDTSDDSAPPNGQLADTESPQPQVVDVAAARPRHERWPKRARPIRPRQLSTCRWACSPWRPRTRAIPA